MALKLLHPGGWLDAELRERFLREARALVQVDDPGVVRLHHVDQADGRAWLVLELVPGETLEARLKRGGPLPPLQALRVALTLCRTLARLHARGVLHRDLKPSNVMLRPDGQPILLDLGLALLLDESARLTRSGEIMGTPGYMSPEQARGALEDVGSGADVYGLGAVLHAMLTGRAPFEGPGALQVLEAILTRAPTVPSALRPELGRRFDPLVLACLARDPVARPSLSEVERRLERLALRRRRLPVVGAALVLVVAAGLAWRLETGSRREAALELARGANACEVARDAPGAAELYGRALALAPSAPEARLWRIGLLSAQGDRAGALSELERLLAADPRCVEAWISRGVLRRAAGDRTGALADLERALELDPRGAVALQNRAVVRSDLGDLEGARADLEQAVAEDPSIASVWMTRAFLRHEQGDYQGALADLARASALRPDDYPVLLGRARAHLALGDRARAQEELERAIALRPGDPAAWLARAEVHESGGELVQALHDLDQAVDLGPPSTQALYTRARLRKARGDVVGAIEDLGRVIELDPDAWDAWEARASCHHAIGALVDARRDVDRALALRPDSTRALLNGATIRSAQDDLAGALGLLERVLLLAPGDTDLEAVRGRAAELRRRLEQVQAGTHGEAAALYERARARVLAGADRTVALEELEQALRLEPAHLQALDLRGRLRAEAGDYRGAFLDLLQAGERAQGGPPALEPRELVRRLPSDDAWALALRGVLHRDGGDFDRAIALEPACETALIGRALTRLDLGLIPGAREDIEKARELAPDLPLVWWIRHRVRRAVGDPDHAADLDEALRLDSGYIDALITRGDVRLESRRLDAALVDFERIIAVAPDDGRGWLGRGIVLYRRGEHAAALVAMNAAVERRPEDPGFRLHRAQVRIALEDLEGARADVEYARPFAARNQRVAGQLAQVLERLEAASR